MAEDHRLDHRHAELGQHAEHRHSGGKQLSEAPSDLWREEARERARGEDAAGVVASGIRLWKHAHFRAYFGQALPVLFRRPAAARHIAAYSGRRHLHWASRELSFEPTTGEVVRVEDGFLRSRGLGLRLIAPLSLILDPVGIHYDPARPSRIEQLLATSDQLGEAELARAEALRERIIALDLSKYNLAGKPALPVMGAGERILVAGQVEDDASVLAGAVGPVKTNAGLLERVRVDFPKAQLLWRPHPDVLAGYRAGAVPGEVVSRLSAVEVGDVDLGLLLKSVDLVSCLTSGLGFEALLRCVPVRLYGLPFYAGWGLTQDQVVAPARRSAKVELAALVHASLIDYPRYFDPADGSAISPELALQALSEGRHFYRGRLAGLLALARGR